MILKIQLLYSLLLIVFLGNANSDSIPIFDPIQYKYTVEDGLNSNFVTDLLNDTRGLLWIGTQNGMNTFDGKQFKSIDFSRVSESFVAKTIEAPDGKIWFTTLGGAIYHVEKNIAIPHPLNDKIISFLRGGYIPMNLNINKNGTIYSSGSYLTFIIKGKTVTILDSIIRSPNLNDTISFRTYNDVIMGPSYVSNVNEFNKPNVKVTFNQQEYLLDFDSLQGNIGHQYCANTKNSFAFSKQYGVELFMNRQRTTIPLGAYPSNSLYFENDTILWVGTQGKGIFQIVNNQIKNQLLPNERVHAFIKDFERGHWIGSETGLSYLPNLTTSPFYIQNPNEKFLFISQYQNQLTGVIAPLVLFRGNSLKTNTHHSLGYTNLNSTENPNISYLIRRYRNKNQYFFETINWENLETTPTNANHRYLFSYNLDSLTYNYGQLFYLKNGKATQFYLKNEPLRRIGQIIPASRSHQYYVMHSKGISIIQVDPVHESIQLVDHIPSSGRIKRLFTLGNYKIASANDDYLYLVDSLNHRLDRIDQIPREDIRTVHELDSNQVLLGTASGLKLLTIQSANAANTIKIRDISNEQGVIPLQINAIELIKDTIYTLSESGIILYPTSLLHQNRIKNGKIGINSIFVNGKEYNPDQKIYNDQTLVFTISSVSFKDRNKYLPKFRLLPINEIGETLYGDELPFYNLPANEYTLQIQDRYGDLIKYSFEIHDYYYEKWWFILLIWLSLVSLIFIPIYNKSRFKAATALLEAEKDNWRLRTLTSQLKPHFIFNALSSIQAYILQNDVRTSSEFLSKFSMHIRNALEQTRTDVFSLNKALAAAETYLELEQMRLNNEFDFQIEIEEGIDTNQCFIPVMLLQPYIENAVVHGISAIDYQGNINIKVERRDLQELSIFICDNGKGLKQSNHKGNGIGTKVNAERIKLINAQNKNQFEVNMQNNPVGNGVCVEIKYKQKI